MSHCHYSPCLSTEQEGRPRKEKNKNKKKNNNNKKKKNDDKICFFIFYHVVMLIIVEIPNSTTYRHGTLHEERQRGFMRLLIRP